ncbi:hypothetical protein MYCTH_2308215 [Thermothelomyces thermophilus ATCC 42464]|uniref:Uncharacterized protein n=1 Tax=Thermothelomyces thermophilus (strain ATCC 42464 / BCRC 31852 / DSM 1799) TaxID=573729 RepID=G2QJH0_THET4|nr:uncharacterized protein MYCTH_2308215 [Thermothelomyces thermophilus ATCC 42464]AEO59727.1 hypothetical protein MYCTH_2308215 [Thermothelomyces thermophilus ATCC 42464]
MEGAARPRIGTTVTPAGTFFSTSIRRAVVNMLVRREEDCHPEGGIDRCKKPWVSSKATWIVVGVLAGLIVLVTVSVLLFFHFRGRRRERHEDLEDRFHNADYGLDELPGGGKKSRPRPDDGFSSSQSESPAGYGRRSRDPLQVGSEPKYPSPGHLNGRQNQFERQ